MGLAWPLGEKKKKKKKLKKNSEEGVHNDSHLPGHSTCRKHRDIQVRIDGQVVGRVIPSPRAHQLAGQPRVRRHVLQGPVDGLFHPLRMFRVETRLRGVAIQVDVGYVARERRRRRPEAGSLMRGGKLIYDMI